MSRKYRAFGLTIETGLELRLPAAPAGSPVDLTISLSPSPLELFPLEHAMGKISYGRSGDEILIRVPWAGDFLAAPEEIIIHPVPGAPEKLLALYLTGLVLVFHLRLRNLLTFHGSAVEVPSGALVLLGYQGSGKSTTAAHLSLRGYPLLCDDAVPVVPGPRVLPGIPLSKLLPDAALRLREGKPVDQALWDGVDKYQIALESSQEARGLGGFILLSPEAGCGKVELRRLKGREKFAALIPHLQSIQGLDDPKEAFSQLAGWLQEAPAWELKRPATGDTLETVLLAVQSVIPEEST